MTTQEKEALQTVMRICYPIANRAAIETSFEESQPSETSINAELLRGCKAALAYLADPPSEFAENRAEAIKIIRDAVARAERKTNQ